MRKFNIFLAFALLLTSCVIEDVEYPERGHLNVDSGIKIFGAAQNFDVKKVSTRADEGASDLPSDSFISEMTMFVFKGNGDIVQGYSKRVVIKSDDKNNAEEVTYSDDDKCSSAINLQKGNPTFLIDTQDGIIASLDGDNPTVIFYDHKANDLGACKIYIVANAWHVLEGQLDDIKSLYDLESIVFDINPDLAMPKKDDGHYRGFPMIGTHRKSTSDDDSVDTFNLSKGGSNEGAVAKIPLKKIYSKIDFSIQVNANQVVSTPKFKIEKVEVFNVPSKAKLGRGLDGDGKPVYGTTDADDYIKEMAGNSSYTPNDYYHFIEQPFVITSGFSRTEISHTTSKLLNPGSEYLIEFSFYMPEHKVTPNANSSTYSGYPENIDEDLKQYYKPMLVGAQRNGDGTTTNGKYATFVRIHGVYTDHNAQIKNVRYDIYLGQDNTDDFTVKRNQLLTNRLIITGLTNYHDAYEDVEGNISIDHRVDVDYKGFNLSMEREATLDSHFEVRPLDIELSPGGEMTVTIPDDCRSWVAMESDAKARETKNGNTYIDTSTARRGVRKYFTTDLVSELTNSNNGTITVRHSGNTNDTEIHRIWFYIDENPNVYDEDWKDKVEGVSYNNVVNDVATITEGNTTYTVNKTTYRNCPVAFRYIGIDYDSTDGTATVTKRVTVNLQQWNLWRVWNAAKTRYYDIECEEEYLNNYASDEVYGSTQNGMAWGLDGVQLSHIEEAIDPSKTSESVGSWLVDNLGPIIGISSMQDMARQALGSSYFYDFYISRDLTDAQKSNEHLTYNDYSGPLFNKRIADYLKDKYPTEQVEDLKKDYPARIDKLTLTQNPQSAFAYCYHKNKRDTDGEVVDQKWYLPAIDEIEDIAKGAYDEFDQVFQNQKYWSCQPAYDKNLMYATVNILGESVIQAEYFADNLLRARATAVYSVDGKNYQPISSEAPDIYANEKRGTGEVSFKWLIYPTGITFKLNDNYKTIPESSYPDGNKLRTAKCRIRAVYRSGTK